MRKFPLMPVAFVAGSLLLAVTSVASGAPILDQSHGALPPGGHAGFIADFGIDIAQTFTVGIGGLLTSVDLAVAKTGSDPVQPLNVEIRSTTAGVPNAAIGSVLASASIGPAGIPSIGGTTTSGPYDFSQYAFVNVNLAGAGLIVAPGTVLALTLRSEALPGGYAWALGGAYAAGQGYFRSNNPGTGVFNIGGASDQFFRTYVQVPEPASAVLILSGMVALLRRRPRPSHRHD